MNGVDLRAVQDIVDRFTVPSNFRLNVDYDYTTGEIMIVCGSHWPDITKPHSTARSYYMQRIPRYVNGAWSADTLEKYVAMMVTQMVRRLWEHELDHWLQFDGAPLRQPHRPDGSIE